MTLLSSDNIKKLDVACKELSKEPKIRHVGVINNLGRLIAGGFKVVISAEPDADDKKIIKKAELLFDDITISTI